MRYGRLEKRVDHAKRENLVQAIESLVSGSFPRAQREALVLVTVQTMNYIHGGHHRVAL
jgi:hypothetical protein